MIIDCDGPDPLRSRPDTDPDSALGLVPDRPGWQRHAACRGMGPSVFFPDSYGDAGPAKAVCAGCPVAESCLQYALSLSGFADTGVWGGATARERQRMRKARARRRAS